MTDANDPANWPIISAKALCIGLDLGFAQDHSALIVGGVWHNGVRSVIGVRNIVQFPLGTPAEEVADTIAELSRAYGSCRVIFDGSNNSAFASILAARFPHNPANYLIAGVITNAADHAAQPTAFQVSLMGQRCVIPRWTLSKRELVESVSAEMDANTLKISHTNGWEALKGELASMERTVRQSGSVSYSAPSGQHDDLVMALALCLFGLRRVGSPARRQATSQKKKFSNLAWC